MRKPDSYPCPGCGQPIPQPAKLAEPDGWLLPDAWCKTCGGTADRITPPLVYGPRWYARVAEEFDKVSIMGLVMEPEQIDEMYAQAFSGAEACADGPDEETQEAIETKAAQRTALAIAVLAYGPEFLEAAKPDPPKVRGTKPTHHDYLLVRFDVTELKDEERDALAGEVIVQAEGSELHSSVPGPELTWVQDAPKRKVVDIVKEAYFHDPTVSNEDYGRLMEEADEQDQRNEWAAEAAPSREE